MHVLVQRQNYKCKSIPGSISSNAKNSKVYLEVLAQMQNSRANRAKRSRAQIVQKLHNNNIPSSQRGCRLILVAT